MVKEKSFIQGFTHIQIGEDRDGKIEVVGDSGWIGPNQVVDLGFQHYCCELIGAIAGSSQVTHMALGTGTVPGAAATSLNGETAARKAVSASVVSSKTLQLTAAWASTDQPGGTPTLQNVGLFATSTAGAGSMFAGNTYATSAWNSNQGISATYQLRFGTS